MFLEMFKLLWSDMFNTVCFNDFHLNLSVRYADFKMSTFVNHEITPFSSFIFCTMCTDISFDLEVNCYFFYLSLSYRTNIIGPEYLSRTITQM
jgi:hypothetical protein